MEDYKVIIEPLAEKDLGSIVMYITKNLREPAISKRIYLSVKEAILSLDRMPRRCPVIDMEPYCTIGVRKLPVENYTAFYIVDESRHEVHVFRVLYNRREWKNLI